MNQFRNLNLLCFLLLPFLLISQEIQQDSIGLNWENQELESELFEINSLKLDRLLWSHKELQADSVFALQMDEIKSRALRLTQDVKYDEANLLLESAIDMISSISDQYDIAPDIPEPHIPKPDDDFAVPPVQRTREITIGSDLWKQEFEMAVMETDSLLIEDVVNPFAQLKLGFDWNRRQWDASFDGLVKNSRDYIATDFDVRFDRHINEFAHYQIKNRFENTHYRREIDLTYWQNQITAGAEMDGPGLFSMEAENEFLVRKNTPQSSYNSDYQQYQFRAKGNFDGGSKISLYADYFFENRWHQHYTEKDYLEHQIGINYFGLLSLKLNVSANALYSYRNYRSAISDTSYYIDYEEVQNQWNVLYRLSSAFSFRLTSNFEYRHHALTTLYTLNYSEVALEPAIVFNFNNYSSLEFGYVYTNRNYEQAPQSDVVSALDEDYFSHGISISIDIFRFDRFMVNVTDIYSIKRYPNSAANDVDHFTLYTDRNINSLIGFFSWNVSKMWMLNVFANFDEDKDPYQNHSNTRSTMLGLELTCNF